MQSECPFPDLIGRALEEDPDAWRELVTRFWREVQGFACRVVQDTQDAEDVCQETFIRVYRRLSKFNGRTGEDFRRWLLKICLHQCLDLLRKRSRRHHIARVVSLDAPLPAGRRQAREPLRLSDVTDDPRGAHELYVRMMRPAATERLTRLLSPDELAVYWLKVWYGYSHDEIAGILELNPRTVLDRFGRARRKLANLPEV